MQKLTGEMVEEYLENEGGYCPYCGSPLLEPCGEDYTGCNIYRKIICLRCKMEWTDEYILTGITEMEQ